MNFKYVMEYIFQKKRIMPNLHSQSERFFEDRAVRRDLSLYRKSMECIIVVYTLKRCFPVSVQSPRSHENTSKYEDTVTFFQKLEPKVIDP